jgi:hypothetical protein
VNSRAAGLASIAALAIAASACSVNVTPDQNAKDGDGSSIDSAGIALPATTNGVATISLPETLLVESMRGRAGSVEPQVSINPATDKEKKPAIQTVSPEITKLDTICLKGRDPAEPAREGERDKSPEGMRRIQHMGDLIQGVTLKATLVASADEKSLRDESPEKAAAPVAELQKEVHCRDLVVLLQNLPVDRKMRLRVEFKGERVAFAGEAREFTFDGKQTVGLKVPLERVDVINERPRIMPIGIVLFRDATAKEVRGIVGDEAQRLGCDTQSQSCKTESKEIDSKNSARLIEIIRSGVPHVMTGAMGRLIAISQLHCNDTVCTGMPLILRGGGR